MCITAISCIERVPHQSRLNLSYGGRTVNRFQVSNIDPKINIQHEFLLSRDVMTLIWVIFSKVHGEPCDIYGLLFHSHTHTHTHTQAHIHILRTKFHGWFNQIQICQTFLIYSTTNQPLTFETQLDRNPTVCTQCARVCLPAEPCMSNVNAVQVVLVFQQSS